MSDSDVTPLESASNVSNVTSSSTNKRSKSVVWDYFEVCCNDKTKAICNLCPKHKNKFSYTNYGTKNLLNHLNSQHRAALFAAERDCKQLRIDQLTKISKVFTQELFEERLIKWIIKNDQPFTEVESTGFKQLLTLFKPNLSIISADTVKRRIMSNFEVKQSEMRVLFENLDSKVSFTTDCWTSSNNLAFMGVTAHYIDKDWRLQVTTLDFVNLLGPHTGSNLHKCFVNVLKTYGLETKTLGITVDNASNNDAFINFLANDSTSFRSFHHIRCFAHVLNLSAQAALDVLKNDLIKIRTGIKKIRSSPQSYMRFKELQLEELVVS
jgi:hypothetical protein